MLETSTPDAALPLFSNEAEVSPPPAPDASAAKMTAAKTYAGDPLVPTIFHEPWWLDIVTGGTCETVEAHDGKGRVIGRLPFCMRSNLGIKRIVMPPLTHFLGPAIDEGGGSQNTRFQKRFAITATLIEKLPHASSYNIKCHRGVTDVIAFQKHCFRTSVQFTHEIAVKNIDDIWKGIQSKRRNIITRAQRYLTCEEINDAATFSSLSTQNLQGYGMSSYFRPEQCHRLIEASLARGQGRVTATRDAQGNLVSALFCIWDRSSYYYFLNTRQPSAPRGCVSLLLWDAIQDSMRRNLTFDMDGISTEESAAFYSGFGATVVPRYIVHRQTRMMAAARSVQNLFKKTNYYC